MNNPVNIAVKDISYTFDRDKIENMSVILSVAEGVAKEMYNDEKEFQTEEMAELKKQGIISNYDDYCEEVGIDSSDVDYINKSFEENRNHPDIIANINRLANKYIMNVLDMPKDTVVQIESSELDSKGQPNKQAVQLALNERYGNVASSIKFQAAHEAEKKDLLAQRAYDKIGEMIESKAFNSFLEIRASIEKYSSNNISLIFTQNPDVKAVMGYNAWKKFDRQVQAGEKSISIWMPISRELKTEKQVDSYLEKHKDDYPNPASTKQEMMQAIEDKGKYEVFSGYQLGSVFDISQTSCTLEQDNYDELLHLKKPLNKDMDNYSEVASCVIDAGQLMPVHINDIGVSQQDSLYNAIYEYSEAVLRECPEKVKGIKSNIPFKGDMHTAESAISTYLVCKHIGIECDDNIGMRLAEAFKDKFSHESITIGRREMFLNAFDRACKLSDEFIKNFDKCYDIEQQKTKDAQKAQTDKSAQVVRGD